MQRRFYIAFVALILAMNAIAQPRVSSNPVFDVKLYHPRLVEQYYHMKQANIFWFEKGNTALREKLVSLLTNANYLALDENDCHYNWLKEHLYFSSSDTIELALADKVFTDAAIFFCKSIYQGHGITNWIQYDELSLKREAEDNSYILVGLSSLTSENELEWFVSFLEPFQMDYLLLKKELGSAIDSGNQQRIKVLRRSMNLLRWIKHFNYTNYVVVNAASAMVRYYECDTVKLIMKSVVGTPSTPTPSFAAVCNSIILYPYWHVPYSIAVNEILPIIKRDPGNLNRKNLQVLNKAGKVINPYEVNWSAYSRKNFPYQFRQSTGCDNALGVLKFNLTDPYSVYMHDTNNKLAFLAGARYFSHGCIRLEKPFELANEFLPGRIDNGFLEACKRDQKPVTLTIAKPVPVFVVYMPAEYDGNTIRYQKDVYKLIR